MTSIDFKNIEWVWVDLDDTIWDFKGNSLLSLAEIYKIHNLSRFYPKMELWRNRYLEVNHALWAKYNTGEISKEFLQSERFARPLIDAGLAEQDAIDFAKILHKDYLTLLGKCSTLVPGAKNLLDAIHSKGLKTGILSNGFKEVQFDKLRSGGILDSIDCIVLSDEIDVNKPDVRIYEYALKKAGTTADKSILIGDNPDTDIKGAVNAHWRAVFFNPENMPASISEDVPTVTSLDAITECIKTMKQ